MRKAKTYISVWNRIKRNPRTVGVLDTGPLPNEDFIDRFGMHMQKSLCESYHTAA